MAIRLISPKNSFVQFAESDSITSCEYKPFTLCLPVYDDNDVYFQFILETDDPGEADALCALTDTQVSIGITDECANDFLLEFSDKPERFRIDDTHILYNWTGGLPNFASVTSIGECFHIKIEVLGIYATYEFCSNCFQRISDPCHTSVIEYGNNDNAFGFDYCGSISIGSGTDTDCDPTFISFTNELTISIPYTASLQAKYGIAPTVQVWIYDGTELVDAGIRITLDSFPPTVIFADFGGTASGVIKISK